MNRLIGTGLLILAVPVSASIAASETRVRGPQFQRVGSESGPPSAVVTALYQDRVGFVWIGSRDGLTVFDGHSFTSFVHDPSDPSSISDDDIRSFFTLLATAGNETVTKLLATAFHELWKNPDQRRILVSDPGVIPNAVEETLRFDPPSQYQGRVTTREVEIHGATIPKGAKLLLINGASGRDERKFPDPDRYDMRREIDFHLGFGYGRHVCLGAFLARLESKIALEEFLARFPDYEMPADGAERMHSSNVRGLSGLAIEPA